MTASTGIPPAARARLREIGTADIVVGIPSFENEATIGHVARTVGEGLLVHFPGLRPVIVNSDGGSADNTRRAVMSCDVPSTVERLSFVYKGLPGKGSACRAIFETAVQLGARACIMVDSDLRSITPQWIERLGMPIVKDGFDYAVPSYIRHKHDGTITNNIAYPMTRALYGVRVRQPIGGDFGLSGQLAARLVQGDVWQTDVARFGIDIWMTTTAVNGGFKVCQTNLGVKVHDTKDPAASLGPMFTQVVGTLFQLMDTYQANWIDVKGSVDAPIYGAMKRSEPEPVPVTVATMVERFRSGAQQLENVWRKVLSRQSFKKVVDCWHVACEEHVFPADLWARVVYDFAVSYRAAAGIEMTPVQVVDALTPLYFGRTAGLVVEASNLDSTQFEALVESQALAFERLKPYLLKRWGAFC